MGRRHRTELLLDLEPDGHRVDAYEFAGQAREEELAAELRFEQGPERGRDLEATLVVDPGRRIAPKHETLLHLNPQFSTEIVGEGSAGCQGGKGNPFSKLR